MSQTVTKGEAPISEAIMQILEKELPSFFSREVAAKHLNGIFTKETLSNFEQTKNGPPVHYMGRRVFYVKTEFMSWLYQYFGGMDVEYHGFGRRVRIRENAEARAGEGS